MSQKMNETLDFQSAARVVNLPAPVAGSEPARLTELNAAIATLNAALAGFDFIDVIARACETTNVNVASPGGTHDGVTMSNGDVLFLTGQSTNTQNGLYTFNGAASALTRAQVAGVALVYQAGSVVTVGPDGTNNKNSLWLQSTDSPVVGTTALTFTQFGTTFTNGTGITITGSVISLTSPVAVANGGTNATTAATARASLAAAGFYEADFGDGSSSSFAITHSLGKQYVHVMIFNKSTGAREDCAVVCNSTTQCTLSAEAWTASPPGANAYHVVIVSGS